MSWFSRLRATLRPDPIDQALDDELQFHIEQRIEDLVAAGMSPHEARRVAARMFGNRTLLRESARERDLLMWLGTAIQDTRFAFRTLRKHTTYAAVSILTLCFGIGATTALFTVVNGVLLRPLPYTHPESLVSVWESNPNYPGGVRFSPGNYLELRAQQHSFNQIGAFAFDQANLTGRGDPERITYGEISASFFPMLGIQPMLGRNFAPEEDSWTSQRVVILSNKLWQERFGGEISAIGQTIHLDDQPFTVIGVMPPGMPVLPSMYESVDGVDLWTPLERMRDPETMHWSFSYYVGVIARLKPGVSIVQSHQDVDGILKIILKRWPDSLGKGALLVPLLDHTVAQVRRPLLILFFAVGLVLLIACANVANLNLGHAAARRREIAVRLALGAGKWRVMRQLFTESLILAFAGASIGLCLASAGVPALLKLAPLELPRAQNVRIDLAVLAFTVLVSCGTAILFGLFPAWSACRADVQNDLRDAGRTSSPGPGGVMLRNGLVVSEIALALMLMVGSALMIESFRRVTSVHPGFKPEGLVTMRIPLSETSYDNIRRQVSFYQQFFDRVRSIPGLLSAGAIDGIPFSTGGFDNMFWIAGRPSAPGHGLNADIRRVDDHYFQTMEIPLLRGRGFNAADRLDSPDVAVISASMAARYWSGQDPIGKQLGIMFGRPNPKPTIIGIAGDVHASLDAAPRDIIYMPYAQGRFLHDMCLVLRPDPRIKADIAVLIQQVRRVASSLDKNQPVHRVRTMEELVSVSVAARYFEMIILGILATVAICLAGIGLYGILAYSTELRTREFGIRTALGARAGQIFTLVLRDAIRLTMAGLFLGLAGAAVLTPPLRALLFEVKPNDPVVYAAVCVLLLLLAVPSIYIPARKATRIEPSIALRSE